MSNNSEKKTSNASGTTVRRTLVLCPAETPPSFDDNTNNDEVQNGNPIFNSVARAQNNINNNGALVPTAQQRMISDSAQALSVLRRQGMMLGNNAGVSSPTNIAAAGGEMATGGGNHPLTRRQPAARSLCYSLGRLSNHHYISSVHATSNPYVSVTPQGPIIMRSGSGVLVMEDGDEDEVEDDDTHQEPNLIEDKAAAGSSSSSSPLRQQTSGEDSLRPGSPSVHAEVEGRLGWRGNEHSNTEKTVKDDFSTQDRLLQCVPGSVLEQTTTSTTLPPSRQPTISRNGVVGASSGSAAGLDGLEDRPTTAGFHAAFHAAPYDRVGNRRGLLELLKLRSDVAAMRGKQKNAAPIYGALKPRGASMPGGVVGASSSTGLNSSTSGGVEYKMMNQHASDIYKHGTGIIPSHGSHLSTDGNTNTASGNAGTASGAGGGGRPSSTGCMPHQTVPWESILHGTATSGSGADSSSCVPVPPHHHDNTLLVSPSTSNVLPRHHQAVIREQADRRAAAAPSLMERSEGELQDELAKQSCDAVGLTPVLASTMPRGRYVVVNMLTTWGDNHEVGICGMEFYNERGDRILPVRVPSFATMMGASTSSNHAPGMSDNVSPPPPKHGGICDTQEVAIDKNLVSITGGAADGSFKLFVEYSATPEELSLWAAENSNNTLPAGFPSGFGMAGAGSSHGSQAQKQLSTGNRSKQQSTNNTNDNSSSLSGNDEHGHSNDGGNNNANSALQKIQMDPRRQVFSVVDGVVNTHDESHMLAIPYTPGHHHLLCFVFAHPITLSMVRIYNYCGRGRVQTFKGARIVEITMDDDVIFRGEVQRHSGELLPEEESESGLQNCENILFTEDENVLCRIVASQHTNGLAGGGLPDDQDMEEELHRDGEGGRSKKADGAFDDEQPLFVRTAASAKSAAASAHGGNTGLVSPPPVTRIVLRHNKYAYNDDMGTEAPMSWRGSRAGGGATGRLGANHGGETPLLSNTAPAGVLQASALLAGAGDDVAGRLTPQDNECSVTTGSMGGNSSSAPRQRRFTNPTLVTNSGTTSQHGMAPPTVSSPHLNHSAGDVSSGAAPQSSNPPSLQQQHQQQQSRPAKVAVYPSKCPRNIRSVCFLFLATWGDPRSIGLSGLRFRDATGNIIREPVFAWRVQYPDGSGSGFEDVAAFTEQVGFLFDEDVQTACTLPFQPAMQLIIVFENPVPSLGFLEVANYSVGERTFCGVKEVRLFLSTGDPMEAGIGPISVSQREIDRYRCLWTYASDQKSRDALSKGGVFEVTPPMGVSLRKAPAYLSVPRFQTYDLSLQAGAGGGGEVDAWGDVIDAGPSTIGIGPGTGGSFDEEAGGAGAGGGALGGMAGGYFATSFASSLNASMNIRAAMAMKRARMVLRDRPDWLLDYQPYITPLLPVGYVCKVRLFICARDVGVPPPSVSSSPTTASSTTAGGGSGAGPDPPLPFRAAADSLKAFMKEWVVHPFRSCAFVNENGELIRPINSDTVHQPTSNRESVVDESCCIPMVVESVISTIPPPANIPYQSQAPLQVMVDLVYVADIPFCMAVLCLNAPLVLDGSAAWVKQVQVFVDDSMVFNSTDAIISLERSSRGGSGVGSAGSAGSDSRARNAFANPKSTPGTLPPTSSSGGSTDSHFPKCVSSMRPYILFTLDSNVLEEVQRKIREEGTS